MSKFTTALNMILLKRQFGLMELLVHGARFLTPLFIMDQDLVLKLVVVQISQYKILLFSVM